MASTERDRLRSVVASYMAQVPMVYQHTSRCLECARWYANAVLMVVDAAFDSIGLNYIQSVVPKVEMFRQMFIEKGKISTLTDLAESEIMPLRLVWRNERSWQVARDIAKHLSDLGREMSIDDRSALTQWAANASLKDWRKDPVGRIRGVGLITYQYLRMMGGVDTLMPDKIVKRVISEMLGKAGINCPQGDIEFVCLVEKIAPQTGYRAIEIGWMTWLIQSEAWLSTRGKYAPLLDRI